MVMLIAFILGIDNAKHVIHIWDICELINNLQFPGLSREGIINYLKYWLLEYKKCMFRSNSKVTLLFIRDYVEQHITWVCSLLIYVAIIYYWYIDVYYKYISECYLVRFFGEGGMLQYRPTDLFDPFKNVRLDYSFNHSFNIIS